jgi:hypothetical protein
MPRSRALILALALIVSLATLGCGSGGRQLRSISASGSGMIQFQFTAIGQFSSSPTSVSPLPVAWYVIAGNVDPAGSPVSYTLSSQPYSVSCQTGSSIVAIAPASPSAPTTGSIPAQVFLDLAVKRSTATEGGFVASTAQTIFCP